MGSRPTEVTALHTQLQHTALAVEASRDYWRHVDPSEGAQERGRRAFQERWFVAKSQARVQQLIACFQSRYDAFPESFAVLRRWKSMEPATRRLICHWHVQLSDPLYRRFSGKLLVEQRATGAPIAHGVVRRWVLAEGGTRWGTATCTTFATKLLTACAEAGLVARGQGPRAVLLPRVPDDALGYLLHLLRGVDIEGSLLDNPYLRSVGIDGVELDARLRSLPGGRCQDSCRSISSG